MIRSMVVRDIRSRYVGSLFGIFWSVIHPLFQLLIYYFVFSMVLRVKLGPEYGGTHFAVWLVLGLLPWFLFSEVMVRAPSAILDQSSLIKKTVFPSEILPFTHIVAALINHLIAFALLITLLLIFRHQFSWGIFWVAPYLIIIGVFAMGLSWVLSSLNVFLRDIGHVVAVMMQIWFYLTPIIYPKSLIPTPYQKFLWMNPMYHAVEGYRMALLGQTIPDFTGLFYFMGVATLVFVAGGMLFKKLKYEFADVL